MPVTQQNIELTATLKSHKYQRRCFLNATHILHDIQLDWNAQCKDMATSCATSCEGQRKDVVRCCLNFGFEGGDSSSLKITGGLGARPQTKLTISCADRQFPAKRVPSCKSRDSRKSLKKQNRWIADFAFGLDHGFKSVALKHNVFMKYSASNLLLWASTVSKLFEHFLLGSFKVAFTSNDYQDN